MATKEAILTLGIRTKQALSDLNNFNSKLNKVGKTVSLKVSAPLLALEGVAVKTFSEMEKGITDITNLVDKGDGFAEIESQMQDVQEQAIEMGFAIDDVNKSLFDNVSALGQGEVALESYEQAQKLAIGGNAQLSETVDGLTSVINAYGRETTSASDVANAFFSAQQKGKTTVSELANNIGKVAPIAKSAGIGFKELLATMSTLTLGGLSTDEATTSLRATISSLVKPTKEAELVLRGLGVPVGALELKQKGLGFALNQLNKAQDENADLLAQAIPNIRALTGVTSFSADKLDILRETQQKMNDDIANGTGLNEAYKDSLDDLALIANQTFGAFKTLANEIGNMIVEGFDLKELMKGLGDEIKSLRQYIEEMTPAQKETALWIAGLVTTVPPATVAITGFAGAIGSMSIAAKSAIPVLSLLASPITAFVAVAGLGVAAGMELYDALNQDEIAARKLSDSLKELYKEQRKQEKIKLIDDQEWADMKKELDAFLDSSFEPELDLQDYFDKLESDWLDDFIDKGLRDLDLTNLFLDNDLDSLAKKEPKQDIQDALQKGSIEAFKAEKQTAGNKTEKQIEKNTRQTAENTKANSSIQVNQVTIAG